MREIPYYSIRTGKNKMAGNIDLTILLRLFKPLYFYFDSEGYFQEFFGFECVDAGFTPGKLGHDIEGALIIALRKADLWPISEQIDDYSEDDIFDLIEFLHEHCSKPTKRDYHGWSDCGWHCSEFDETAGREEFRSKINPMLKIYGEGFELSLNGEILTLPDSGLDALLEAPLPAVDPENVEARISAARIKFRRSRSSIDERRDAVRDLADVLEYLRPKIKGILSNQDESDLFNLANNFGIRHHNPSQKLNYDKPIWYSWLFYHYLATIHAVLRLIAKEAERKKI
jgi:hypothetical protein